MWRELRQLFSELERYFLNLYFFANCKKCRIDIAKGSASRSNSLPTGVLGNPQPGTMLFESDVHSNFHSSQPFCSLFCCSLHFFVPRTRLQLSNRTFCVAGPVTWNSLPLDIRSAPTFSTFKNGWGTEPPVVTPIGHNPPVMTQWNRNP